MKRTVILSIVMMLCAFVFDFNADCIVDECMYFPDGKSGLYLVERNKDGSATVWHCFEDSKSKIQDSINFDNAFCSDGSLYLTENRGRILYVMPIGKESDLADVSLSDEYIMSIEEDHWYFLDRSDIHKVIKYDYYYGTSEEINFSCDIDMIFTDKASKNVFGISKDGVIDINKNKFIECEVPKMPFKFNVGMFTDSDGKVYSFDSQIGFEAVLDTGYENICCTKNTVYALDNNEIYQLDENGDIISVCYTEICISDIISSGDNLYGIADKDVIYIPKSSFVKYANDESVASEISEIQSKVEVSSAEPSRVIQRSVIESSVKEYSRVIEKSVIEMASHDYSISIDKYAVSEDMIFIGQGTTVAGLKKGISYGDNKISITNHNGKSVTSGTMGTGWRIDFSGNGAVKSYYTVVTGDVTGEGNINTRDIYLMKEYIFGKEDFSKYQLISADINENGIIDSVDLYLLARENQLI